MECKLQNCVYHGIYNRMNLNCQVEKYKYKRKMNDIITSLVILNK